jgi:NAD(P)-dependent dehydrogenase (short-subunit alcohol dehydrogenase family)
MHGMCEGRVCVVTGAGRGLGREYALMMAAQGAKVVVNDLGGGREGSGSSAGPAQEVVEAITAAGGEAVANVDDVADVGGAKRLIGTAIGEYGRLDVLVNNAGILRDRMLVNMIEAEWDAVIRVHLKGTWAPSQIAAAYWRDQAKAGEILDARLVNTTSVSGIYGNPGQTNYGAAKAGIAAFTQIASLELARYGVTVNAIAPAALTRLTEDLRDHEPTPDEREASSPRWVAPLCTWLASRLSTEISGRVFEASPRFLAVAEGWHRGPIADPVDDPLVVDKSLRALLADARPNADMSGQDRAN